MAVKETGLPRHVGELLEADAVVLCLVFLLIMTFSFRKAGSHDTGFHLRAGESILNGEGFPEKDSFTYTLNNHDYVDTSWGFQVVLSLVNRTVGVNGMIVFNVMLVLLTFFVLFRTVRLGSDDVLITALFLSRQLLPLKPDLKFVPNLPVTCFLR